MRQRKIGITWWKVAREKEILDFEKALSAAVNAHVNKLLSELDQQWTDVSKSIDEETNKVKKNR